MPTTVIKTVKSAGGDYSSLPAWESGEQGDLVAADEIRVAECYFMTDTQLGGVAIAGSTVDATRYMIVRAAAGAEAGMPWNTSTAYLLTGWGLPTLYVNQDYTRIERIQIEVTLEDNSLACVSIATSLTEATVRGCYVRHAGGSTFGNNSVGIMCGSDAAGNRYIINNVVEWDFGNPAGGSGQMAIFTNNHTSGKTYVYNNTIIGSNHSAGAAGTRDDFSDIVYKNNLIKGFDGGAIASGSAGNCTTNAADDATPPGASDRLSQTFTFISSTNFGLHSSDTGAKGFGTDLSADANYPFSTDFLGNTRSGSWDIGAIQTVSSGPPLARLINLYRQYRR